MPRTWGSKREREEDGKSSSSSGSTSRATKQSKKQCKSKAATKNGKVQDESHDSDTGNLIEDFVERVVESVAEVKDDASDGRGTAAEQEAAVWKRKFEELQALRMTAPEQRLANLTTKLDAQEASIKKMTSSVRGMLQRSRVVAAQQRKSSAENVEVLTQQEEEEELAEDAEYGMVADSESVELLEAKLEQKREVLRFYQKLTGIVVEPLAPEDEGSDNGAEEDTMSCTAINHIHKRAVKFELQLADGGDQAVFVPVANMSLLPTTLRKTAQFESQQLPMFLQKVLKQLYA